MASSRLPQALTQIILVLCLGTVVRAQPAPESHDPGRTWKEADSHDDRWSRVELGPFLSCVMRLPNGISEKGMAIRLGERGEGAVCFDTQRLIMRAGWHGEFLAFDSRRFGLTHPPRPAAEFDWLLPRENGFGEADSRYRGLYQHGRRVVLEYETQGTLFRESPWMHTHEGIPLYTRTMQVGPRAKELQLTLAVPEGKVTGGGGAFSLQSWTAAGRVHTIALLGGGSAELQVRANRVKLILPEGKGDADLRLVTWSAPAEQADAPLLALEQLPVDDLAQLMRPAAPLWPERLEVAGRLATETDRAYVVDTIGVPFKNPYQALFFLSGHDFLPNGDLLASTLHGDVWLVQGIDAGLKNVRWKRFATGLHQPFGVRVVRGVPHVLGKDQITRLHDRDGDGEADWYECFNNDGVTSTGGHDYAAGLEADREGNFYYIRAHTGFMRVAADGSREESVAAGWRNPVGMGVSPEGMLTAAPQEGNWTPASGIFVAKPGGWYGYEGPKVTAERPLGYDPPLCWLPRAADNSSGGQCWVTSDRWGPLSGRMLHFSYGLCSMMLVLQEQVDGVHQGGVVTLPLQFSSGAMRGRFSPHDGQLYVTGTTGWQTRAAYDGCLERVRYTGRPLDLPVALHATRAGLRITFSEPLDAQAAADPDNYLVEVWNYRYAQDYGSREYKPSEPGKFGRDELFVDAAEIQSDGRTVLLAVEDFAPVMQMRVTCRLKTADGRPLEPTIYNTIHTLGAAAE